jgi:hypothetical protein
MKQKFKADKRPLFLRAPLYAVASKAHTAGFSKTRSGAKRLARAVNLLIEYEDAAKIQKEVED